MSKVEMDYGHAYAMEVREVTDHLRSLRDEGSEKLQYVPGIAMLVKCRDLDEDDISACAIFEAEKHTNMAINMRLERLRRFD